jgi:hypothetical protein
MEASMVKPQMNLVALVFVAAGSLAASVSAGQQGGAAGSPTQTPTKEAPLRFRAVNQATGGAVGLQGVTQITIERWTTDAERQMLLSLVDTATPGEKGQRQLLTALQKIKPRVGFMRTPNSPGWDLRYAVENTLPDGTRQIVIATDKPVRFATVASDSEGVDYPFTLIEMRMMAGGKGEGRMLSASAIAVKNGRLELANYGNEPVRLTDITETQKE